MRKSILLLILVISAFSLLQCQYAKQVLEDLAKLPSAEDSNPSGYSSEAQKSSSSEIKKTRKEANP